MTFMHDINDGQSGSPLWIRWKNSRAIAGIVSTHPITLMSLSKRANAGLRITNNVLSDILGWARG